MEILLAFDSASFFVCFLQLIQSFLATLFISFRPCCIDLSFNVGGGYSGKAFKTSEFTVKTLSAIVLRL